MTPLRLFAALIVALLGLAAAGAGMAQGVRAGNPVFTVSGIAVDASADSAAAARPVALQEGQRRAFQRLMARLTYPEDRDRVPRVSEALLNETVAGFEIDEERTSPTRYIGRITVRFRPDAVRNLLQTARLAYSETGSRPILVLPAWQAEPGGALVLFQAVNPWRDAWKRRADADGLVPFLISEPADGVNAPPLEQLTSQPALLRDLAQRRQAGDVLLVGAANTGTDDRGQVRIEVFPYLEGGTAAFGKPEAFVAAGATVEEALSFAAATLAQRLESAWKQATRLDLEKSGQISAAAAFGSLADWNKLRTRLGEVPVLQKYELLRLTHRDAQLLLQFFGDPEQLVVALAQKELHLERREGFWELRLAEARRP